jgi:Protein kinase domain/SEFIR domain
MTPRVGSQQDGAQAAGAAPVTAFVSWAHDDETWEQTIADFVLKLRELGIDADADLFHLHDNDVNWAQYGPQAIEDHEFVLLATSLKYKARWEGRGDSRTGAGAVREANVLKSIFDDDRRDFQRKVKVVVLPGATSDDIPRELSSVCPHFDVQTFDLRGLENLMRTLIGRPKWRKIEVGAVPLLPPALLRGADDHGQESAGQQRGLLERLGNVERRLDAIAPDDTVGRENLESQQSTIGVALRAVQQRVEGQPRDENDLSPGTVLLDRYRIERVIAHGGQGVVYAATQMELERIVAIKLVSAELASEQSFSKRFKQEARLAANIDHDNILPVYDSGELPDGSLFLAMKFVDGPDLSTRLRRDGALVPREALPILWQIAAAIDAAHANGLIHRDVKPANVLLEPRSSGTHAYLTDFGLARTVMNPLPLTKYHYTVGTAPYMAPEQIRGGDIDGRVDVYAFGCTLYESLAGKPPYGREAQHLTARIPLPSDSLPDVPPTFDAAVQRAMAKDRAHRADSAREVMELLTAPSVPQPVANPPRAPASGPAAELSSDHVRAERSGPMPMAARIAVHAGFYATVLIIAYLVGRSL